MTLAARVAVLEARLDAIQAVFESHAARVAAGTGQAGHQFELGMLLHDLAEALRLDAEVTHV